MEGAPADAGEGDGCFLCAKHRAPEHEDADNLVLYRGVRTYVILNLYPYNTGHTLVAPYEHSGDLAGLAPDTGAELMRLTQATVAALGEAYAAHGFNVGINLGKAAGAGVPDHLHVHVVPRWSGDTNFLPLLASTKVLPETLVQTYQRLEPLFQQYRERQD